MPCCTLLLLLTILLFILSILMLVGLYVTRPGHWLHFEKQWLINHLKSSNVFRIVCSVPENATKAIEYVADQLSQKYNYTDIRNWLENAAIPATLLAEIQALRTKAVTIYCPVTRLMN